MKTPRSALVAWVIARLAPLRFPVLFLIAAGLFLIDLAVPDMIPFADEVLLGLATALLASWRKQKETAEPSREA